MKKRMISFVTLAAVVLSSISFVSANGTISSEPISEEEMVAIQEQSNNEYNRIYQENSMGRSASYPSDYAGGYLDENGELVVLTTDDSEETQKQLKNMAGNQDLQVRKAEYSYEYLQSLADKITDYMNSDTANSIIKNSLGTWGVYDDKNCIIATIKDLDTTKIDLFKSEISDSGAIRFENQSGEIILDKSLGAGACIKDRVHADYSIGYRARRSVGGSYEYGFVTCGHGNAVGDPVYDGMIKIGQITAVKFGGNTDAAFVKITNSDYNITNSIARTNKTLVAGGYRTVSVGTTINKSGCVNGVGSGQVTSSSFRCSYQGSTFTDLIQSTYPRAGGDSGCIVYSNDSSPYIVGTHMGATVDGRSISVKANNIVNSLNAYSY
ncbi:hypothetical protein [Candidatus Soleaferrea massiliensis]|uniref:hypothetical protein n=1 Tax=Candidatus Soleaferrea massiliensis TaxID=1470354 RepID=UPI00058EC0A5|nr:hypothetical protein [Candidatus Soleaferrea massiliensis]